MANEFKVKKGLIVDGISTVLDVQGTQGQLFSVTDSLTGDLFSVSDVSGVPIFNINSSGEISIGDGDKLYFGASNDLQIYHDGSNSYIDETGTGDLIIKGGNDIIFKDAVGNLLVNMNQSDRVELYFGGSKKFETENAGASVTGNFYLSSGNFLHFDNGGSNNYAIRKTGTTLEFKTGGTYNFLSGNASFASDVTITGNLTVNGTQTILNTETVEVEDNIILLNKTGTTATATTSGISIYRGSSSTAGFIFDDADDTWDLSHNLKVASDLTVNGNIILSGSANEIIKSNGSVRINIDSDNNQGDRVFIVSNHNNNELFRVDESGHTLAQGVVKADGYFQVNSSSELLRKYVSGWSSGVQSHDVVYNGWRATTGDYTYLKAAGNSTGGHGVIVAADLGTYLGTTDLETGAIADSATAPLDNTWAYFKNTDAYIKGSTHFANKVFIGDKTGYETEMPSSTASLHIHEEVSGSGVAFGNEAHVVISTGATSTGAQGYTGSLWFGSSDHPAGGNTLGAGQQFVWRNAGIASTSGTGDTGAGTSFGNLEFYTNHGTGSATKRLTISSDGISTFDGNVNINGDTTSPHSDNAFVVNRGSDGAAVFRIQNTGEQVSQNNYFYAAAAGVSFYCQNTAVFRGAIMNDGANDAPVRIGDSLKVEGSITIPNYLIHDGDSDTQFGFSAANTFIVHTGGSDRFSVSGDVHVTGSTDFAIPAGRKLYLDGQSNTYITESSDGVIDFYGDNVQLLTLKQNGTQNEVIVNEGSTDIDFRVESNQEDYALFVEGEGTGKVGIGTGTPSAKFEVQGSVGQLFSVTDSLTGDLFSVSDVSGIPILNVNSSGAIDIDGDVTFDGIHTFNTQTGGVAFNVDAFTDNYGVIRFRTNSNVSKWDVGIKSDNDFYVYNQNTSAQAFEIDTTNNIVTFGTTTKSTRFTSTTTSGLHFMNYTGSQGWQIGSDSTAAGMYIYNENGTYAMKLTAAGNVTFAGDITVSGGDINLGTNLYAKKIYRSSATISSSSYTTVATVAGDNLGSAIRMVVTGTSGNVVMTNIAEILVNHSTDILIKTTNSFYRKLYIKIVSDGNEDFAIELKRDGDTNNTTVQIEIEPLGDETVTFTNTHGHTAQTLEHVSQFGETTSQNDTAGNKYHKNMLDNQKLKFGDAGTDLQIYHDGSNSYISDGNSGSDLKIRSNHILLQAPSGENMIFCNQDAEVKLYYNNSAKFETLNTGVEVTGTMTATGDVIAYSDERLKTNVETLDGSKVYEMRGVSFTKDEKQGSGVIAQELEKVAPELVNNDSKYKAVAYGNITGYLIEAIKDLKQEIEQLKKQINNG